MLDLLTDTHVETYCENGVWKSRRNDSDEPFSAGGSRLRQIAAGAEVARWNQCRHVVRDPDGSLAEETVYGAWSA
jgi:hypothetical protein